MEPTKGTVNDLLLVHVEMLSDGMLPIPTKLGGFAYYQDQLNKEEQEKITVVVNNNEEASLRAFFKLISENVVIVYDVDTIGILQVEAQKYPSLVKEFQFDKRHLEQGAIGIKNEWLEINKTGLGLFGKHEPEITDLAKLYKVRYVTPGLSTIKVICEIRDLRKSKPSENQEQQLENLENKLKMQMIESTLLLKKVATHLSIWH